MAMATVGPGLVMPGIQPWSDPTTAASSGTSASPSAPAAPASPAPSSLGQDNYAAASTPSSQPKSGVVQAKSFLSNLWDMFFGPLLNGLWGVISSIFHGL